MATIIEEKKKKRRLVYLLIIVFVATVFVLWYGFFRNRGGITQETELLLPQFVEKQIEINLKTLENPLLKELVLFEKIAVFDGQFGRENPFTPLR